jgi:hypothetical protein
VWQILLSIIVVCRSALHAHADDNVALADSGCVPLWQLLMGPAHLLRRGALLATACTIEELLKTCKCCHVAFFTCVVSVTRGADWTVCFV